MVAAPIAVQVSAMADPVSTRLRPISIWNDEKANAAPVANVNEAAASAPAHAAK